MPGTNLYSWVDRGDSEENEKCPIFETVAKGIRTRALSIASPAFYHWATALHNEIWKPVYCSCPSWGSAGEKLRDLSMTHTRQLVLYTNVFFCRIIQ